MGQSTGSNITLQTEKALEKDVSMLIGDSFDLCVVVAVQTSSTVVLHLCTAGTAGQQL